MAIVRWCLDPRRLSGLEFEEFLPGWWRRRWRMWAAGGGCRRFGRWREDSVGCEVGPAVEFEAQVMVEGLKRIREVLRQTEEQIQEICSEISGV